jgi:hypothetical protein
VEQHVQHLLTKIFRSCADGAATSDQKQDSQAFYVGCFDAIFFSIFSSSSCQGISIVDQNVPCSSDLIMTQFEPPRTFQSKFSSDSSLYIPASA